MSQDFSIEDVDFDKGGGLVPVVVQDAHSREVLMLAYTDREALGLTLETELVHFHSRKRGLWKKGETSGNVLHLVRLTKDCDGDTILAEVRPHGPACHTGSRTCFGEPELSGLARLWQTIEQRAAAPSAGSYTSKLLADKNLRHKKIGEEATELVMALTEGDRERSVEEAADVVYHAMVALAGAGISWSEVVGALETRAKK